ncbi:MAG: polyhydroxyalkanoate synthesis repressor PhaR [Gammaproteobacteria bacterium]|nr:polyhydroxyalkanoate synthesis repressor PhaR [Gammaproteobacteria bacterium]
MTEPRVIKKYPNRRLYDTEESRYITLTDIKRLVMENVNFMVIDKKSSRDITNTIMLQVICELEQAGLSPMTRNCLGDMIRASAHPQGTVVGSFLEQSLRRFLENDQSHARSWPTLVTTQTDGVDNAALAHFKRWETAQDQIYRTLASVGAPADSATTENSISGGSSSNAPLAVAAGGNS